MLVAVRDALTALESWLDRSYAPADVAICTIHGNSASYDGAIAERFAWPKLQIERLRQHTPHGYTVFAFGNRLIDAHENYLRACPEVTFFSSKDIAHSTFDHVWPLRNWLARQAMATHKIIVHLDSDAFPVRDDWLHTATRALSYRTPVIAVQRLENGDTHSDRCFLVHTRGGFRRHAFDFSSVGVKDPGGAISKSLEESGFGWTKLTRSNAHDYHPLISALYGDLVYHHGAGSRQPHFRANTATWGDAAAFEREQQIHRVLMQRIFEDTDALLDELRGKRHPFDLEAALSANPLRI